MAGKQGEKIVTNLVGSYVSPFNEGTVPTDWEKRTVDQQIVAEVVGVYVFQSEVFLVLRNAMDGKLATRGISLGWKVVGRQDSSGWTR